MDFIATLGVIALIGMLIRSSVILIDHRSIYSMPGPQSSRRRGTGCGRSCFTAAAAILDMLPIAREVGSRSRLS